MSTTSYTKQKVDEKYNPRAIREQDENEDLFKVGDKVVLNTEHGVFEYKGKTINLFRNRLRLYDGFEFPFTVVEVRGPEKNDASRASSWVKQFLLLMDAQDEWISLYDIATKERKPCWMADCNFKKVTE